MEREQFREILAQVRQGKSAALPVEAEGLHAVRRFRPAERLLILGGGHVAQPLCQIAALLGFAVTVADDRPDFVTQDRFPAAAERIAAPFAEAIAHFAVAPGDYVAVLTRGHRWDADCLRAILGGQMPYYLGMIGSRRRTAALLRQLGVEGFPQARLEAIHAPIGLAIGALTPQEIAVSIAGELVQCRRADAPGYGTGAALACEDADLAVLEALADGTPRALLLVCAAAGSTPAKSGALMTVDAAGNTVGTIGGGAGEHTALQQARALIGTGRQRLLSLDLGGEDVNADAMICGGSLQILLADLQT